MTHPIYQLLSARLACIEAGIDSSSVWFCGDRTPEALTVIRQWAADHADVVVVEERKVGVVVDHRRTYYGIVVLYPSHVDDEAASPPVAANPECWRPSDDDGDDDCTWEREPLCNLVDEEVERV